MYEFGCGYVLNKADIFGSAPIPSGSFANILNDLTQLSSDALAQSCTPCRYAPVAVSTSKGLFRVIVCPFNTRGFAGSATKYRKMPERAVGVYILGMPNVWSIGCANFVFCPCQLPKKNVLLFLMGPPASNPN